MLSNLIGRAFWLGIVFGSLSETESLAAKSSRFFERSKAFEFLSKVFDMFLPSKVTGSIKLDSVSLLSAKLNLIFSISFVWPSSQHQSSG